MGVDFTAYSNLRTEPLPQEYRREQKSWSEDKKRNFIESMRFSTPDIQALLMAMYGVSRDPDGSFNFPLEIEPSNEEEEKARAPLPDKENSVHICYRSNTIYYKTPKTKEYSTGRSYSGYGEFIDILEKLNKGKPLKYMPPSTDSAPENGTVKSDKARQCLESLQALRYHFVPDAWEPDINEHYYGLGDQPCDRHEDTWFFKEFYTLMTVAVDNGLIHVY